MAVNMEMRREANTLKKKDLWAWWVITREMTGSGRFLAGLAA